MSRLALPLVLGSSFAVGCASIDRHLSRDEYGQACLAMAEQYEDDEYTSIQQAIGEQLDLRWTMQVLDPSEVSGRYGLPVANGEHGVLAQVEIEVRALPPGARSVELHSPDLTSNGERQDEPDHIDIELRDAFLPSPAELVEVDIPAPYERSEFEPSEPPPRLKYVPGSGREPAPSRAMRDAVKLMTLGLVKQPRPGPRLTDASRRALRKWQKRNDAEFKAWRTREDQAASQANAARNEARDHNTWVFTERQKWEQAREEVWRELVTWPCAMKPLAVGERCVGVMVLPTTPAPVGLRFMSTMDFAVDEDGCDFTISGDSPTAQSVEQVLTPFAASASQTSVAPVDYVGARPWI